MAGEQGPFGLRAVAALDPEPEDPRVTMVLEVLGGRPVADVAAEWDVEAELVRRWVGGFVEAGAAVVTNRPDPRAARERDRFLAGFAHELRTPLAVARGWLALLAEGEVPPAMLPKAVVPLRDSVDRLCARVEDIELLVAASLGRLELHPKPVAVAELLLGLGDVEVDLEPGAHDIVVDPEAFRRVVRDLLQAAAMPPAPWSVRLVSSAVDQWAELRVVRTADPIDPRTLHALFEPFDGNEDDTGVSVGLYLARAIVVAHGGTMGLEQNDDQLALWVRVPRRVTSHRPPTSGVPDTRPGERP